MRSSATQSGSLALTAQRRAEVAAMAWEDVDLVAAEWRQPGHKNKTGKPHVVPLGAHALELLKRRWEAAGRPSHGLVLPGVRYGGRMDANLSDLQGTLREATGIEFRLHDFRRAAVSAMAERGVDFAVADAILNHAASESRAGMLRRLPARRTEAGQAAGDGDLGGRAVRRAFERPTSFRFARESQRALIDMNSSCGRPGGRLRATGPLLVHRRRLPRLPCRTGGTTLTHEHVLARSGERIACDSYWA